MNSVNRAMGRPDLYPFVLAPAVVEKLRFIHDLSGAALARSGADAEIEAAFADAASPLSSLYRVRRVARKTASNAAIRRSEMSAVFSIAFLSWRATWPIPARP